jgi:hypothetical protein
VVEKRTRGEAHADLRQAAESGWDRSFKFDPPREELALFRPEKAGLNSVSIGEAARYIEQNRDSRPWLQTVERSCPETRWIFAAADLSGAHWPVRHEGWVSEERSMRRVAYLEDPAQLDPWPCPSTGSTGSNRYGSRSPISSARTGTRSALAGNCNRKGEA